MKDLQTGEELHVNPDVPFSGGGVMKLPIVAEIYRKYDLPLDVTTTQRLTAALTTELSNLPANQLLNQIGEGNTFAGAQTTDALRWPIWVCAIPIWRSRSINRSRRQRASARRPIPILPSTPMPARPCRRRPAIWACCGK